MFIDCEICDERFHDDAIKSYLREVELDEGEVAWVCIRHSSDEVAKLR